MTSLQSQQILYRKDKEGNCMRIGETDYGGEVLTHDTMFTSLKQTLDNLKSFEVKHSDVWLISYPKSGTHWLFEIISILLSGQAVPHSSYLMSSVIDMNPDINQIPQHFEQRMFSTHSQSKYLPDRLTEKCKIIYLVRNPKSVALSWYHFVLNLTSMNYSSTMEGFLPLYMDGLFNLWGSWFDHVIDYWQIAKTRKNVLFVFYDELIKEPVSGIKQISDFLELNHTLEFCEKVATLSSFQNMKAGNGKPTEVITDSGKYYKDNEPKLFRKGESNEWKEVFTVAQNEKFDERYYKKMQDNPEIIQRFGNFV